MKNRIELLNDLINFREDIDSLVDQLSIFPWDTISPLVILKRDNLVSILQKCINDVISFEELEKWANALECRDDIGFEDEYLKELVTEFANSDINSGLTKSRLNLVIGEIEP